MFMVNRLLTEIHHHGRQIKGALARRARMSKDNNMSARRPLPGVSRFPRPVIMVASMLALAACASKGSEDHARLRADPGPEVTGAIASPDQAISSTQQWARALKEDPDNIDTALKYAASLRRLGSDDKALQVLRETAARNPKNALIVGEYGKQLASMGKSKEASKVLQQALGLGARDWRIYSAQATALDTAGEHERAREYYEAALKLAPDEPAILNNLGMSHALAGNLAEAEATLRPLIARPGAPPRARQNLALVLGLQGRFKEAREIASADLPAAQVEANLSYLRNLMSKPDMWSAVKQSGAQKTAANDKAL